MKTAILLVTFNRLDCLRSTLNCYDHQTVPPSAIVVVDNASNDDTVQFLDSWREQQAACEHIVIRLETNTGGAGGFAAGFRYLEERDYDWMLIGDDDAYPENDTLEGLFEAVRKDSTVAAYCTAVINEGKLDLLHRRKWQTNQFIVRDIPCSQQEYSHPSVSINVLTFVGAFINLAKARKISLPEAGFFIYYDDVEYSLRLAEQGLIELLPRVRMHHDTGFVVRNETTWKSYYYLRNKLITFHRHGGTIPFVWESILELIKKTGPLSALLKRRTKVERQLYWRAITDAWENRIGEHPIYRPGWKSLRN
ncbi:MAG: glycosyltransferase [Bifidobacterium tibiigranuli]|jgi:GT2 family glycosyltransferase|nr:glycosyltransferase [Bifidobacterium tibiigranuli]